MNDFEELLRSRSKPTFVGDLIYSVRHSRKLWMLPIMVALLLFGCLMLLGGTAAAPFIYTLF